MAVVTDVAAAPGPMRARHVVIAPQSAVRSPGSTAMIPIRDHIPTAAVHDMLTCRRPATVEGIR